MDCLLNLLIVNTVSLDFSPEVQFQYPSPWTFRRYISEMFIKELFSNQSQYFN